jgi:nucleoside-diphosphate-sugar epimerase
VGEVMNIGSNFEISIGDLANKIISLIGKNTEIITDPARVRPQDSEVERLWCDNTKAKRLLGWVPTTSLDDGLKKTIEWISENINLYKPELYNR